MRTPWREQHQQILDRVRNNDETLTHLKIVDPWKKEAMNELDYSTVMGLIQRSPNAVRDALMNNTCITSIDIQPYGNYRDEDHFIQAGARPSEFLARCIGRMGSVRHFTIDGDCTFDDEHQRDILFSFFLRFVPQITTLCLKIQYIDRASAETLDRALGGHPTLESLKCVFLCDGTDEQQEYFPHVSPHSPSSARLKWKH